MIEHKGAQLSLPLCNATPLEKKVLPTLGDGLSYDEPDGPDKDPPHAEDALENVKVELGVGMRVKTHSPLQWENSPQDIHPKQLLVPRR